MQREIIVIVLLIIVLLVLSEVIFVLYNNFIKYNFYKFRMVLFLPILIYSMFFLRLFLQTNDDQNIKYLYIIGFVQGIIEIFQRTIEDLVRKKKGEEQYICAFNNNLFLILCMDNLEKYTIEELEKLKEFSENNKGIKGVNLFIVNKDIKRNKIQTIFIISKWKGYSEISHVCEEYCEIEEKVENTKRLMLSGELKM